ncbi:hypothetical protein H4R24_003142 [Coemansia sp. RSA 988]|nr:hypothetical protein H4R24_003142 [Coemansia sp. RSA 988]
MQFVLAIAALAAAATAQVNTMQEISENWDNIKSVINGDLPTLKAANPAIYAQATSVIGGEEVTQDFNVDLVQQVATGIDPGLMNAVLSRAGVEGVSLDGKEIPTDENAESESSEASPTDESSSEEATDASSESDEDTAEESDVSEESGDSESDDSSDESSESDEDSSEDDEETDTSGAAAVAAAPLAAGVAAIAAAFF